MKCPECDSPRYKFKKKNEKLKSNPLKRRKQNATYCNKCKFEGHEHSMNAKYPEIINK